MFALQLDTLIRFGLGDSDRQRLGCKLDGERSQYGRRRENE